MVGINKKGAGRSRRSEVSCQAKGTARQERRHGLLFCSLTEPTLSFAANRILDALFGEGVFGLIRKLLVNGLPVAHHRGDILAVRHKVFERLASELVLPGLIFAGLVRRRGGNYRGGKHQSDCKAFHRNGSPRGPRLSKEKGQREAGSRHMWLDAEEAVRADLAVLENERHPLWDRKTNIVVRAATIAEQAAWRSKSVELSEDEDDHDPDDTVAFLVSVKGPYRRRLNSGP
jgi:hypothetical protein